MENSEASKDISYPTYSRPGSVKDLVLKSVGRLHVDVNGPDGVDIRVSHDDLSIAQPLVIACIVDPGGGLRLSQLR